MAYKFNLSQGEEILLKVASIGAALLGIVGIFTFYKNNIWKPTVEVEEVDYKNGVAKLKINGKPFILRGDSSYLIGFDWGIKFGFTPTPDGKRVYDRIELLKRNMVHKVLRSEGDMHNMIGFTGFNEKTFWNNAFDGDTKYPQNFTGSEEAITNDDWGVKSSEGFSIFNDK
jgi:hypothetical protein